MELVLTNFVTSTLDILADTKLALKS